jgi:hypothetical protein
MRWNMITADQIKNGPMRWSEEEGEYCFKRVTATGYQDDVPAWLSVWLLIIVDNEIHLACNGAILLALR